MLALAGPAHAPSAAGCISPAMATSKTSDTLEQLSQDLISALDNDRFWESPMNPPAKSRVQSKKGISTPSSTPKLKHRRYPLKHLKKAGPPPFVYCSDPRLYIEQYREAFATPTKGAFAPAQGIPALNPSVGNLSKHVNNHQSHDVQRPVAPSSPAAMAAMLRRTGGASLQRDHNGKPRISNSKPFTPVSLDDVSRAGSARTNSARCHEAHSPLSAPRRELDRSFISASEKDIIKPKGHSLASGAPKSHRQSKEKQNGKMVNREVQSSTAEKTVLQVNGTQHHRATNIVSKSLHWKSSMPSNHATSKQQQQNDTHNYSKGRTQRFKKIGSVHDQELLSSISTVPARDNIRRGDRILDSWKRKSSLPNLPGIPSASGSMQSPSPELGTNSKGKRTSKPATNSSKKPLFETFQLSGTRAPDRSNRASNPKVREYHKQIKNLERSNMAKRSSIERRLSRSDQSQQTPITTTAERLSERISSTLRRIGKEMDSDGMSQTRWRAAKPREGRIKPLVNHTDSLSHVRRPPRSQRTKFGS